MVLEIYSTKDFIFGQNIYEERSISSRTVLLSKHTVTVENQNYYEVVLPLMYITLPWSHL